MRLSALVSHRWMPFIIIPVLTFAAFAINLGNELVLWDDLLLLKDTKAVHAITWRSIRWIFTHFDPELYIPITFFSYQIDHAIGGGEAWVFHLTNLLLHIFNAILVFFCVERLLKGIRNYELGIRNVGFVSLATTLLFALHPIQVEAVAWAAARKDILSGLFFLLSLYLYLQREWKVKSEKWETSNRIFDSSLFTLHYSLSLLFFFLALLSKVSVAPLPLILLLVDWLQGRKMDRRAVIEKIPFFVLSLIFIAIAFIGKSGNVGNVAPLTLFILAFQGIALQLFHLVLPFHLSVLYPASSLSLFSPATLIAVVILLVILGLIMMAWRKNVRERSLVLFGAFFFLLMLAPSFFSVMKAEHLYITADRYVYIAVIGIFLMFSSFIYLFLTHSLFFTLHSSLSHVILALLLAVLIPLTVRQSLVWRDTRSLFEQVLKIAPENAVAHMNLGAEARLKGDADRAIAHYQKSYEAEPSAAILGNIAEALTMQAKYNEAEKAYSEALRLKPDDAGLLFGRGTLELFRGNKEEAAKFFLGAITLDPLHAGSHHKLAILLGEKGDTEGAITHYRAALQADPLLIDSRYNLAVELTMLGEKEEARVQYEKLLAIDPSHLHALVNYGVLLFDAGDFSRARKAFQAALKIDPADAIAQRGVKMTEGR